MWIHLKIFSSAFSINILKYYRTLQETNTTKHFTKLCNQCQMYLTRTAGINLVKQWHPSSIIIKMTLWRQFSIRPSQLASKNHFKNQVYMYLCTHSLYIRAQNTYFTKVIQMVSEMCVTLIYSYICVSDINL